jgi:UDP-N-acetylmuramoylalanine--D-glutamate ligase
MSDFKNVLIIGGGESGLGAALLAREKGCNVLISDGGKLSDQNRKELINNKIPFEEKGHTIDNLEKFDLIIKSPGVPGKIALLKKADDIGISVWSEIEFGFHFCDAKIIGITGSNGKTTTTALVYQLLNHAGIKTAVGGNYGTSFCRLLLDEENPEWIVLELSSFQLEDIEKFRPQIAVLLNITADHLDRYNYDIYQYAQAKFNITKNQINNDLFIFNGDDLITTEMLDKIKVEAKALRINKSDYENGIYSKEMDVNFDIKLFGKHNLFNAYCAISIARHLGISDSTIGLGLKLFKNNPHRLEKVVSINERIFINDSKATNVDAVYYALEGIASRIVWIAGGTDKGNDYSQLVNLAKEKVKALICLGKDNRKLKEAFQNYVDQISETQDVREAVNLAYNFAGQGEVILLSPACASFDLFNNYEDRGEQFKEAVWDLVDKLK